MEEYNEEISIIEEIIQSNISKEKAKEEECEGEVNG